MALKERYTVTVAGYELNVRSDNTPEEVAQIVGALDRSIRDVCTRNRTIPLSEAIILCALDAYAEQKSTARRLSELEEEFYGKNGKYTRLERENELLRAYIERHSSAARENAEAENDDR